MSTAIQNIRNFYQQQKSIINNNALGYAQTNLPGQQPNRNTPVFQISRVQFERIRVDVKEWRDALIEAENSWNPTRVKMHRIYQDTVLNEHVKACIAKRIGLTLQRKFKMCDDEGNENVDATKIFKTSWFRLFQRYCIEAILNGYNIISMGDIVNDAFPNLSFVRRQNVNVDRLIVTSLVYSLSGQNFLDPPFTDFYIYVPTPSDTGVSQCGYGLLYNIARTEIFLRNNSGQNADFNEVYGQPIRTVKTTKQDAERSILEKAMQDMGSNAYMIIDDTDELELLTGNTTGRGFETFDNFEARCEKKISKILLGHADAMDSTPGKLGAGQDGEESPVNQALSATQSEDAEFILPIINNQLLPRMIRLGFNIPLGLHFEYKNDDEAEEFRRREDDSNQKTATVLKTIKDAGGEATEDTWKWFEDRTGIPGIKVPEPPPPPMIVGPDGNLNGDPKTEALKKQVTDIPAGKKKAMNGKAKFLG